VSSEFDPVDLAVLSSRYTAIVRSMSNTLIRTGRSVILNQGRDFSCCIVTAEDELFAMAESIPIHLLCGPDLMARSMKEFHPGFRQGDAFIHNSPYHGNSHAADMSILVPVFDDDGRHRFTVLSKAHLADIGNAEPTPYFAMARDVYEEGAVILPCVKVQSGYRDIEDVIRMCRTRIRVPDKWWGDYLALLGAARVGEREVRQLAAEVGWDRLDAFVSAWFDYSEQRMVEAIERLPNGRLTVHAQHDPFERAPDGVALTISVEIGDDEIEIDLRDNPDCQPFGLNLTEATARSAAMLGVMNAINGYAPANAGAFRRIRVLVRENCCVGIPRHPASCSVATCNLVDRVGNAVQRAIAEMAEGYGLAEVGYSIPASLAVLSGNDPRHDDEPYIDQIVLAYTGGPGGPSADGWLTMAGLTDSGVLQWNSVELDELRFPIRIDRQRIAIDTEGIGRRRGAPAAELELTPTHGEIECMYLSDGTINPPLGVRGGGPGATARQATRERDGVAEDTELCARLRLRPGTTLLSRCCGGGGYGDPLEREPARVAKDVSERIISRQRAFESYGVVLDDGCRVDSPATQRQRAALRSSKEARGHQPAGPSTSARISRGEDQRVGQR
jgi:N-methylhydantoinase B/oxoprolinase/acetone carboxylase alpha subunit